MSDDQSLNDPELQHLSQFLGGLTLRPSDTERSNILLACGRAEGRADAQRTIRKLRGGMLVFAGVSVCLLGLLLNRPFASDSTATPDSLQITEAELSESPTSPGIRQTPVFNREAVNTFGVMTPRSEWDREPHQKPRNPSPDTIELVSQQETLTTHSRTALNELLN